MADRVNTTERLKQLRNMGDEDLDAAVETARRTIYTVRRQRISQPVPNSKWIRTNRKEIARILTIKRQRQIVAAAQAAK